MALLTAALNIGSLGDAVDFLSDSAQDVVRLRRRSSLTDLDGPGALPFTLPELNPFSSNQDEIFLNVVEQERLDYSVNITEKPVADLGSVVDYVSRVSTPLTITSIISNRSFNVLSDPYEALTNIATSLAPNVVGGLQRGAGLASKFVDQGGDEMDAKIKLLRLWQTDVEIVEVYGLRLDTTRHLSKGDSFNYLIEKIELTYSPDFGDGIGLTLTLKNLLRLPTGRTLFKRGGKIGNTIPFPGDFQNPFRR